MARKTLKTNPMKNASSSPTGQKNFLPGVDNRTWRAKAMKTYYDDLVNDLGGPDYITTGQDQLARRVAGMAVIAQEMEADFVTGQNVHYDFDQYMTLNKTISQLLSKLGIKREAKNTKDIDLDSYLN